MAKGDSTTHTYTAQGRKNHDRIKWGSDKSTKCGIKPENKTKEKDCD